MISASYSESVHRMNITDIQSFTLSPFKWLKQVFLGVGGVDDGSRIITVGGER